MTYAGIEICTHGCCFRAQRIGIEGALKLFQYLKKI